MKKDSIFKIIGVTALIIIVLWVLQTVLFPTGYRMSVNYTNPGHMNDGYNYSFGSSSFSGSITLLLQFLTKVSLIAFVIALFVGIIMLVKDYVFTKDDIASIKNSFTIKSSEPNKVCTECGRILSEEWKVCPHCGKEVDSI